MINRLFPSLKKKHLICIIGPDGSGKTTQAKLLVETLTRNKIKAKYRWLRFHHHRITLFLLVFIKLAGLSEVIQLSDNLKIGYSYIYKSNFFSHLYPLFLYLDILIFYIYYVYIPLLCNFILVCDRFIYDTLVDIIISTKRKKFLNEALGILFLKLIPSNSLVFLLSSNENNLRARRLDVNFDKTLNEKIFLYTMLAKKYNIITIDSDQDILNIHNIILQTYKNYIYDTK